MPEFTGEMKRRNRDWQKGYSDGYRKLPCQVGMSDVYYTGYEVGKSDREDDDEAVLTGTLDLLTEEERLEIYGDENDRV